MRTRFLLALAAALILTSCGYGSLQTAKTLPEGAVRLTLGEHYVGSTVRPVSFFSFPGDIGLRIGLHERVDMGISAFYMGGLLVDAKVNAMPPEHPFALAFSLGFAGAVDPFLPQSWLLHAPVHIHASYTFIDCLSPYAMLGYDIYWIFGRPEPEVDDDTGDPEAARGGYGDGVLRVTGGLEWQVTDLVSLYLEYSYHHPVVSDTGDRFAFFPYHTAGIGIGFTLGGDSSDNKN
ncbi:MAG TPA: hypothetical protein PLV42_00545 [bacterium]|nr:hypothetical protein [bacterium]